MTKSTFFAFYPAMFLIAFMVSTCSGVTPAQESQAITALRAAMNRQNNRLNLATVVRLMFHDSVGPNGMDGCVNLASVDNAGLAPAVNILNDMYPAYSSIMSRADFWATAGYAALLEGAANANNSPDLTALGLRMRYGRIDCPTSPTHSALNTFPEADGNLVATMGFFTSDFGFSQREVVALLGAHTLGDMEIQNSGYGNAPWVRNENRLDNAYYQELVNSGQWSQQEVPASGEHQWESQGRNTLVMLNADQSLFRELTPDGDGVEQDAQCRAQASRCPMAASAASVVEFSNDNGLWLSEFTAVYMKMVEKGSTNLQEAAQVTTTTTTTTTTTVATTTTTPAPTTSAAPSFCSSGVGISLLSLVLTNWAEPLEDFLALVNACSTSKK